MEWPPDLAPGDLLVFVDHDMGRWWVQIWNGWQLAPDHPQAERLAQIREDIALFHRQPSGLFVVTADGEVVHPGNYWKAAP